MPPTNRSNEPAPTSPTDDGEMSDTDLEGVVGGGPPVQELPARVLPDAEALPATSLA